MKKLALLFMVFSIALFAAGCFEDDEEDKGTIRIVNTTSEVLDQVYISPSTSGTWGSDWFDGTIGEDGTEDFSVEVGTYDVRVANSTAYADFTDVVVTKGAVKTLTVLASKSKEITPDFSLEFKER